MERLGWWLCAGLEKLGAFESDGAGDAAMSDDAVDDPAGMLLGGVLRESRIAYPLAVDAWQAVGEHLFEEQEDGVGTDQDVRREVAERAKVLAGRLDLARDGLRLAGHRFSLTDDGWGRPSVDRPRLGHPIPGERICHTRAKG